MWRRHVTSAACASVTLRRALSRTRAAAATSAMTYGSSNAAAAAHARPVVPLSSHAIARVLCGDGGDGCYTLHDTASLHTRNAIVDLPRHHHSSPSSSAAAAAAAADATNDDDDDDDAHATPPARARHDDAYNNNNKNRSSEYYNDTNSNDNDDDDDAVAALRDVCDALLALPSPHPLRAQWTATACVRSHAAGLHAHCVELYVACVRDELSLSSSSLSSSAEHLLLVTSSVAHDDAILATVMRSAVALCDVTALRHCRDVVVRLAVHGRGARAAATTAAAMTADVWPSSRRTTWRAARAAVHATRLCAACVAVAQHLRSNNNNDNNSVDDADACYDVACDVVASVLLPPPPPPPLQRERQAQRVRSAHDAVHKRSTRVSCHDNDNDNNNDNGNDADEVVPSNKRRCWRLVDAVSRVVQYSRSDECTTTPTTTATATTTTTAATLTAASEAAVFVYFFGYWCDVCDVVPARPLSSWLCKEALYALLRAGVAQRRGDVCELATLYVDRYLCERARAMATSDDDDNNNNNKSNHSHMDAVLAIVVPLMLRCFALTTSSSQQQQQQQQQHGLSTSSGRALRWLRWLRATFASWRPTRFVAVAVSRVAGEARDVALATWCLEALLGVVAIASSSSSSGTTTTAATTAVVAHMTPPAAADVYACVCAIARCGGGGVTSTQLRSILRVLRAHALLRLRDDELLYVQLLHCTHSTRARDALDLLLPRLLSLLRASASARKRIAVVDDASATTRQRHAFVADDVDDFYGSNDNSDDDNDDGDATAPTTARAPRLRDGGGEAAAAALGVPVALRCVYAALVAMHASGDARFATYYVRLCRAYDARHGRRRGRHNSNSSSSDDGREANATPMMRVERARWTVLALRCAAEKPPSWQQQRQQDDDNDAIAFVRCVACDAARQLRVLAGVPAPSHASAQHALYMTSVSLRRGVAALRAQHSREWWQRCLDDRNGNDGGDAAAAAARALFVTLASSCAPPPSPPVVSPALARALLRRGALRDCGGDACALFTAATTTTTSSLSLTRPRVADAALRAQWQRGVLLA